MAVNYAKRRAVNVNHPARPAQTIRAAGDHSVRMVKGQTVTLTTRATAGWSANHVEFPPIW